ncbi:hypothetical protein A4A49_52182 [Nicotiana attenuata]|uniref:Uncharacterized protein n=1 Tax=Nicotiana attenuata TaxID=49451 RepID=A0A314KUA5_NICAT|nr:hypothetical protein A4A49_52182 [Nicotiana attenuata]
MRSNCKWDIIIQYGRKDDSQQEEAKMLDLNIAEPEGIAEDECLSNKAEEKDLAHRSEDLEERANYGSN